MQDFDDELRAKNGIIGVHDMCGLLRMKIRPSEYLKIWREIIYYESSFRDAPAEFTKFDNKASSEIQAYLIQVFQKEGRKHYKNFMDWKIDRDTTPAALERKFFRVWNKEYGCNEPLIELTAIMRANIASLVQSLGDIKELAAVIKENKHKYGPHDWYKLVEEL
jgi:hypothetical protein